MGQQLDDSELTNSETRHGELPTLRRALDQSGLLAGAIYRQVIEEELDARQTRIEQLKAENKRLQQENDQLRADTKEKIREVLAETGFDSATPDQDG